MKILDHTKIKKFTEIPNIGPAMAKDFKMLGIAEPKDLAQQDALSMFENIQKLTDSRHDPCVLDTYMAAVDFMRGAEAQPWWNYTSKRKALLNKKVDRKAE